MQGATHIKEKLAKGKRLLGKKYPIRSLAFFGSYAREEQHPNSDLDVLVEFDGKIGIEFIDFAEELQNLLGLPIDLVSKNGIKPKYFQAIKDDLIYV